MHSNQKQHELLNTDSFKTKFNKSNAKKQTLSSSKSEALKFDPIETDQWKQTHIYHNQPNVNANNLLGSSYSRSLNSINKKNGGTTDLVQPLLTDCNENSDTKSFVYVSAFKQNPKMSYDNLANDKLKSESLITFNEATFKTDKYNSPSIMKMKY
jgi:hypothetical protein